MAFLHPVDIDALNARAQGSLVEHVGIVVTAAGDDWLRGTMPVDARTRQPYGLLHGGASVVLAETLGSMAGGLCVDPAQQAVVGLETTANHLLAGREGVGTGTAPVAYTHLDVYKRQAHDWCWMNCWRRRGAA